MSKTWDQILDLKEGWPNGELPAWFDQTAYQSAAEEEIARLQSELETLRKEKADGLRSYKEDRDE